MDLTFRSMNNNEAMEVKKLARKSFGFIEGLFVTKPKTALVAIIDEKIVGGFVYQLEIYNGKRIGFISFLFADPVFQGQGIGKQICDKGIQHLWEMGCDNLVTFVRDDNVASWGTFKKNGFVLTNLQKVASVTGLLGAMKLYIKTLYGLFDIGHDFYIASAVEQSASFYKKEGTIGQVLIYVLLNTLFFLPLVIITQNILPVIVSSAFVFLGIVSAGYIGTLFSRRKWNFRFTGGGAILYFIINIFPNLFFPLIGNWYPIHYENTSKFKRDMAMNVISVWLFLLCLLIMGKNIEYIPMFLKFVPDIVAVFIILKCLPLPVFESGGFGRVFKWNKIAFGLLAIASAFFIFIL